MPAANKVKNGSGVIVLHQFPRGKNAPSPSPYPLKVETFLRMTKLPYTSGMNREILFHVFWPGQ